MLGPHVADAAGNHDRLVIAADLVVRETRWPALEGPEVARQVRAPELVIEGRPADRPLDHDLERRRHAVGMRKIVFPRLSKSRYPQVRHGEPRQAGLRLRAEPRRAFVTDFPARPGRRARKRRNRRRMVVGLDLHEDVDGLLDELVFTVVASRHQPRPGPALDDRGVVAVRGDDPLRCVLRRRLDHPEQPLVLRLAVDDPRRVEDLVAAVLGIRLREHHEFRIGRIASQLPVTAGEVFDLFAGQREPEFYVGPVERRGALRRQRDGRDRYRIVGGKQRLAFAAARKHRLGHPVRQQAAEREHLAVRHLAPETQPVTDAAFDPYDRIEVAGFGDIGRLGRPG